MRIIPLLLLSLSLLASTAILRAVPAFPGAEGFGAQAKGARASATPTVYRVTNLNDSGTGSLRDAVGTSNRIVIFDVGGIIRIKTPLVFASGLTIAGQTAPGDGVTVYGNRVSFSGANNTLCRYMRFRMGIEGDDGADAVGVANGSDMVFDHVSASWGRDETFSISGDTAVRITLQDCLIAQGLRLHSAGGLMQTSGGVSIFRSLYADNWMRNPKIKGVNDFINNVVYNWGSGGGYIPAGDSAGDSYCNLIGCYFIAGPETGAGRSPFSTGNTNYRLNQSGNLQDLDLDGVADGVAVTSSSFPTLQLVGTRFAYPAPTTELTAAAALEWVLSKAGASRKRDRSDDYVVAEARSFGTNGAFIYNETEMGGVGTLDAGLKPSDADNDGVPDWWEVAAGTDPAVADATVLGSDGYLNIERYLNAIVTGGVPGAVINGITSDTGSFANDGITSDRTLVLNGTAAAGASVAIRRADTGLLATVTANDSGDWIYDYSGTSLADRYYAFTATATVNGVLTPPSPAFVVKVDTAAAPVPIITAVSLSPGLSIQGTATPGDTVVVSRLGIAVGTAVADALGNWTAAYTGAALAAGTQSFTAVATDLAGNSGSASVAYQVNTAIAPPAFTSISTDSGTSSTDLLTNDTTLTLSGTAPASSTVSITRAGVGVIGGATAGINGSFSYSYATTLSAGAHVFTATASQGGIASPSSAAFAITVDTTVPTIVSIYRRDPAIYSTNGGTVVFRVTFAEPVVGVDASDFTLTKSGATGSISALAAVSSTIYDITAIGIAGDGTVRLDLNSSGTGIADVAGNAISGAYTSGQSYTVRLAGSGIWATTDSLGLWSQSANWESSLIAGGSGTTADFSLLDLVENTTLVLDSARTLHRLVFGDTDYDSAAGWTISDGGVSSRTLAFDTSSTPIIQVNALTTAAGDTTDVPAAANYPHRLDVALTGSLGFSKSGVGCIELNRPNPGLSGPLSITKGVVQIGPGGSLSTTTVTISTSQQLRVAGGAFTASGNVSWTSGTGTGVIVSSGTASFQNIVPSNTRNSFFKVTGGTVTGKDMNFPRSGDSEAQTVGTGVIISGGDTTFANIGLGTNDSWGGMTVSGGKLTVTGTLYDGYQVTAGRGGVIYLSGGELAVTGTTNGLVMARNPGSNTNNVAKLLITGGSANLSKLTLGYDSAVTAGSATVSLANGQLNLGSGGMVKNGSSGLTSTITLNSGTLGALASWSASHPLVVAGTPSTLSIRTSDLSGTPRDITLGGVLSGVGGFAKVGGGSLFLTGNSTFTGDVSIQSGTLDLAGSLAVAGSVTVNSGATLAGAGACHKSVALASGASLSPTGALTLRSLDWSGGGRIACDLGAANDRLLLENQLTKSGGGPWRFDFLMAGAPVIGTSYTLVTFTAGTNFTVDDFSYTGLGDTTGYFTLTANSLLFTLDERGAARAPFLDWLAVNGITRSMTEASGDPDGDGSQNLMEFVLGTRPDTAGSAGVVALTVDSAGIFYPAIRFTRRVDRGGVVVTVEADETLTYTSSTAGIEVSAVSLGNGIEQVTARSTFPISERPRQFLRVHATLP